MDVQAIVSALEVHLAREALGLEDLSTPFFVRALKGIADTLMRAEVYHDSFLAVEDMDEAYGLDRAALTHFATDLGLRTAWTPGQAVYCVMADAARAVTVRHQDPLQVLAEVEGLRALGATLSAWEENEDPLGLTPFVDLWEVYDSDMDDATSYGRSGQEEALFRWDVAKGARAQARAAFSVWLCEFGALTPPGA